MLEHRENNSAPTDLFCWTVFEWGLGGCMVGGGVESSGMRGIVSDVAVLSDRRKLQMDARPLGSGVSAPHPAP